VGRRTGHASVGLFFLDGRGNGRVGYGIRVFGRVMAGIFVGHGLHLQIVFIEQGIVCAYPEIGKFG
jgi:hypothetical protein